MEPADPGPAGWPWSPELDGPIAASNHHKVIFENDRVRVLETRIPAGDTAPLHTHRPPALNYVLSGSHFIRRDPAGATLLDTRAGAQPFELPRVFWAEGLPAHTLENAGDDDILVIAVELKDND